MPVPVITPTVLFEIPPIPTGNSYYRRLSYAAMGNQYLLYTYERLRNQLAMQTVDIPDGGLCRQPLNGINHAAWILGHMIWFEHGLLTSVLNEKLPIVLDPNWTQVYGSASEPRNAPGLYKVKTQYLLMLEATAQAAVHALSHARPETFEQPNPNDRSKGMFPTIGTALAALCTHRSYHLGQLAIWRRIVGLPHAGL